MLIFFSISVLSIIVLIMIIIRFKKFKTNHVSFIFSGSETAEEDNEEQIYWLRPAVATPHQSPDSSNEDRLCWFSSNKKPPSQHGKHKVTFNEATSTSNIR